MLSHISSMPIMLVLAAAPPAMPAAQICQDWSPPERVGSLDFNLVSEASGLAISRQMPDRLYHINDSGDGPFIYSSALDGTQTTRHAIENFEPLDVEGLALGACPENRQSTCLFVGDIGDNRRQRAYIEIVIVEEPTAPSTAPLPARHIYAAYPDGPHNAEGLAVHPNGDIFILTKEEVFREQKVFPAHIFKLPGNTSATTPDSPAALAHIATIDFPALLAEYDWYGQIPTGLDISADGTRFVALTYQAAVEFGVDLAKLTPGEDDDAFAANFSATRTAPLIQQEAIAYTNQGHGIIYDTEYIAEVGDAPIFRQVCDDGAD